MLVIKPLFGVGIILHNNQIKNIKRLSMSIEQTREEIQLFDDDFNECDSGFCGL